MVFPPIFRRLAGAASVTLCVPFAFAQTPPSSSPIKDMPAKDVPVKVERERDLNVSPNVVSRNVELIQNNMQSPTRVEIPVAKPGVASINNAAASTPAAIVKAPVKKHAWKRPVKMVVATPSVPSVGVYPTESVALYVGEAKVIPQKQISRIAIGNGKLLSATVVDDKEILLLGESTGTTVMHVWLRNGYQYDLAITVQKDDPTQVLKEVQGLLSGVKGVKARRDGSNIILEGQYSDREAVTKVKSITDHYPQVINQIPLPAGQTQKYDARMVYLEVKVVEIRKSALDRLGVQWDSSINGPTAATSGLIYADSSFRGVAPQQGAAGGGVVGYPITSTAHPFTAFIGLATQITSSINFLEQNGDSWTLAEPRMSCLSGEKAKFQVGGEIPIPVSNGLGTTTIVYHNYGVILEFEPTADSDGNVTTKIGAEISDIDAAHSSAGLVAFTKDRTDTVVKMKVDQTLILSGLLKDVGSKSTSQLPGLGNLPVLGALFRNKQLTNDRTDVMVMVTPRMVAADTEFNLGQINKMAKKIDDINRVIDSRMAE